jgi:single-strand DNA-binding protein
VNATLVTVSGNVVADPQLRQTPSGVAVASFRLASTERRRDGAAGEWRDVHTSFYQVTCWRTMAQRVVGSLQKGDAIVVTGKQQVRNWQNPEGVWHTIVDIEASSIGPDLSRVGATLQRKVTAEAPSAPEAESWTGPFDTPIAADEASAA